MGGGAEVTPEQQRITIAEACGWEPCEPRIFSWQKLSHAFKKDGAYYGGLNSIPDYSNDLNAMHEAEKMLTDLDLYRRFLYLVVLEDPSNTSNEPAWATATQRAEAFLRTIGKWKGEGDE